MSAKAGVVVTLEVQMKQVVYAIGMLVVLGALATPLLAGAGTQVPEIDGASITTGLGLLAGGILMARARWRAK